MKKSLMARLFRAALLPALLVGALVNSQTASAADQVPANPSPSNNRPMTQVEEVNLFRANHKVVANQEVPVKHEEGTQSLDEEALRVCKAKLSKGWIPAQDKGEPVISVIDVPVSFRLK